MPQPFAALETRLNQAVFKHVVNAAASAYTAHGQIVEFDVIFDAAYGEHMGGLVGDVSPMAQCKTADVADLTWDSGITVDGTAYTVASARPDGTGITLLQLREA